MTLALLGFSGMALSAREVSQSIHTFQLLFFRSLIGLLIISFILNIKGWHRLSLNDLPVHFSRNISHFIGQYAWFFGIAFLPLSEVFALEFTVPFWTAIFAAFLLGEKLNRYKIIAIIFGMTGVLLILKPGVEILQPAAIGVLIGATSYGVSHTLTRKLALKNNVLTILFYMSLIQMMIALIPMFFVWQYFTSYTLLHIIIISVTGLIAHYSMAKALTHADTTIVVPIDFLRLPLITLLAYFLYQEEVDIFFIIGACIMLSGNMINVIYNRKQTKT